ncbi:MAG: NUDIX hydrolase [Actinomycetota bacterium]
MMNRLRRLALRGFGLLPSGGRRFVVRRVAPAWTAGAVAIVERDDGRWLMVKPVYRKGWSLPGGIIDRGESPAEAVVREFMEELGLRIQVEEEPWVVFDSTMRRIETVFRAELLDDIDVDAVTVKTYELEGVGWFPPDDPPVIEQEALDVVAVIRKSGMGGTRVLVR